MDKKQRIWLSEMQKTDACERYERGESPDSIADSFGVCANNIRNTLRANGVEMRDRAAARTKHAHRQDAFDILTPESAYWLGFFFADGTVYRAKIGAPIVAVGLAASDIGHLEKLRTFLGSTHAITRHRSTIRKKTHSQVRLTIRSQGLAAALARYGMKNKSLRRVASAEIIDSEHALHFWRGVVDGDGYVGSRVMARIGVCGGKGLMQQFLDFCTMNSIGLLSKIRRQKSIYRVDFTKSTAVAAIRLLYGNGGTRLERKYDHAQNHLQ